MKLRIVNCHNGWWQVVNELGHAKEQFRSRGAAEAWMGCQPQHGCQETLQRVSQRFGVTMKRISVYP